VASIHLIAWDNGRGLTHDIRLLESTLRDLGHEVHITSAPQRARGLPWAAWKETLAVGLRWLTGRGPRQYDLGITLEHVHPAFLRLARRNVLIPNPEWLSRRDRKQLHRFDAILCKTRSAQATFEAQGLATHLIGFDSIDCKRPGIPRQKEFLHLAGASRMKGTDRLIEAWRRHPEWPTLHLLQSPSTVKGEPEPPVANLDHRIGYVGDIEDIRRLQNTYAFQICLSEAEGWGHYIVEAMSCGAVVLATDGAPMNELVGDDRGILVAASENGTLNAATLWRFDDSALEAAVERAQAMDDAAIDVVGSAARQWFDATHAAFPRQLGKAIDTLV
jgi:glycosyltransferase involved in cell wall biosynthesis